MSLQGQYELLLRAYPRGYRRVRGPEILTTLMDAAPDGTARPSARDTLDILAGGLRNRLGVRGWFHRGFAAVTALALGCALGGIAATLTWRAVDDAPAKAAALSDAGLTGEGFLPLPTDEYHQGDPLGWVDVPVWLSHALPLTTEGFEVDTTGQRAVDLRQVQAGMTAAGWDVRHEPPGRDGFGGSFTARRDHRVLTLTPIEITYEKGVQIRTLTASIYHVRPVVVTAAGVAGGLLGGLLGWGLVAAISAGLRPGRGRWAAARLALEVSVVVAELLYLGRVLLATGWDTLDQSGVEITYPMVDLLAVLPATAVMVGGLALLRLLAARSRTHGLGGLAEHRGPTTS